MKLLCDARHIALEYTGLGRYCFCVAKALAACCAPSEQVEFLLEPQGRYKGNALHSSLLESVKRAETRGAAVRIIRLPAPLFGAAHHMVASAFVNYRRPDRYFYPHFDPPYLVRCPAVITIHDLLPLTVGDYVQKHRKTKLAYFSHCIRHAFRRGMVLLAVSASTQRDLVDLLFKGDTETLQKIIVRYEAPVLPELEPKGEAPVEGLPQRFLLYVGDRRPHKNLKKTIDLFNELRYRHNYPGSLVLAGNPANHGCDLDACIRDREDIAVLGNVPDAVLRTLYRRCEALLFLSRYEGFGLPLLEAAYYSKKMVTSNLSSTCEIAPSQALVLDPLADPASLASAVSNYLSDGTAPNYSAYLNQFSWNDTAEYLLRA